MSNPVLVEIERGGRVESGHRGAVAVARADGGSVVSLGDVAGPIYPRSAVKALQAIPLIESGAADAFGLDDRELAVACASHNGEPEHIAAVRGLLSKARVPESALACGAHWPLDEDAARTLAAAGGRPGPIHNNCSGKHAGMLATAAWRGEPAAGYERADHPVQGRIRAVIEDLADVPLDASVCAIDGCSVPTWALPLEALARALARFATGVHLDSERGTAAARLMAACFAAPAMVAGRGRFCTEIMRRLPARAFVKAGAEGVYCGALPELGLGIAIKIDDGGRRGAETAMANVIAGLAPDLAMDLEDCLVTTSRNWRGTAVGHVRPSDALRKAVRRGGPGAPGLD